MNLSAVIDRVRTLSPGVGLCLLIAAVSLVLGHFLPVVGSALPAVFIGFVIAAIRRPGTAVLPGVGFSSKMLLQVGVTLLGTQLSLRDVAEVGVESLPVMLSSLTVCLLGAIWIGRALGIAARLRTLIGVGTGICGGSAIAAVAPVIGAASGEIAYAISTIFVFNIIAAVVFPILGHLMGLDAHTFGLLAGTAVNDTSSVVAAASAFAASALGFAVIVKLVRTLMIVPVSIGLSLLEARRSGASARDLLRKPNRLVPWFLLGFLLTTVANSVGWVSPVVQAAGLTVSTTLIAAALAGIGLSTNISAVRTAGWRPLILGGILSILVTGTAVAALFVTGYLG